MSDNRTLTAGRGIVLDNDAVAETLTVEIDMNGGSLASVVATLTNLRAIDSTLSNKAFVFGSATAGDSGGGFYIVDPTDTTSADDGRNIIVATDSTRWKLWRGVDYSAPVVNILRYIPPSSWADVLGGIENVDLSTFAQAALNAERAVFVPGMIFCGSTQLTLPAGHAIRGPSSERTGGVATTGGNFRWRDALAGGAITVNRASAIQGITLQSVGTPNVGARGIQAEDCHELHDVRIRDFPTGCYYHANQFYSRHYGVEIRGATTAHWFASTAYNFNMFGPIIRGCATPFKQDSEAALSMTVHGGSIEGMSASWTWERYSNITFDGTYFELNASDWAAAGSPTNFHFMVPADDCTLNFVNCTPFVNYIARFINASGLTNFTLNCSGNQFCSDATADAAVTSVFIYPPTSGRVTARGDSWARIGGPNARYFNQNTDMVAWDVIEPTGYPVRAGVFTFASTSPPSLAGGASQQFTCACPGAAVGMKARATFSNVHAAITWRAEITGANQVTVTQSNVSGSPVALAIGTLTVYTSSANVRN